MRFAGEGTHGEGNQVASLEDALNRELQDRQLRRPPAIVDSRAAAPLGAETPAPCNAEQPLVLRMDVPSKTVVAEAETDAAVEKRDEPKPSQPTLHKQSVEEASAAVMNSLLSRDQARAAKAAEKAKAKAEAKAAAKEANKADPKAAGTKAGTKAAGKVKPKARPSQRQRLLQRFQLR